MTQKRVAPDLENVNSTPVAKGQSKAASGVVSPPPPGLAGAASVVASPAVPSSGAAVIQATRGRTAVTQEVLRAHAAAALRLENVGVLLGAGASVPAGGQTMNSLWAAFAAASSSDLAWLEQQKFPVQGSPPNLESLLDEVEVAYREWTRMGHSDVPKLRAARNALRRAVIRAALLNLDLWTDPGAVFGKGLEAHRGLISKLCLSRQPGQPAPWVFTTNYDLSAEWAAEAVGVHVSNGFRGLHSRVFAPQNFDLGLHNTIARGEAQFGTYNVYVAKLHGSLTWRFDANTGVVERQASAAAAELQRIAEGNADPPEDYVVYPHAGKYLQTAGFAFAELIRRFSDFLARPQTALWVSGCALNDEHLNRIIAGGLQNPTLQLFVYLPELTLGPDQRWSGAAPNSFVNRLLNIGSPQVTIVGGGPRAFINELVGDLPDPILFNRDWRDHLAALRDLVPTATP